MRGASRVLWVVLFALVLIVGGVAALILMKVPAPQEAYEHALDLRATASAAPMPATSPTPVQANAPTTPPPGVE